MAVAGIPIQKAGGTIKALGDKTSRDRMLSLDVFRGITVAAMLLVKDPGNLDVYYWPLDHAEWHGWTPTDLVFPFFLFVVGITTHLSLQARRLRGDSQEALLRQVLRRTVAIFLLGLILNWFPFYSIAPILGQDDAGIWQRIVHKVMFLRIPGVLQRIALCYFFGALLSLVTRWRGQVAVLIGLLLGYWAVLVLVPVPGSGLRGLPAIAEPSATLGAWIDRGLFDWGDWGNHLWSLSKTWDPEGALSTLPAIGSVISGLLAGCWIGQDRTLKRRVALLWSVGAVCFLAGLLWDTVLPINKKIWTSSFTLMSAGMAAGLLAALMLIIDLKGWRRWTEPFVVFGVNPILAYALSHVALITIYFWWTVPFDGRQVGAEYWVYDRVFASWLPDKAASLAFSLFFVLCFYVFLRFFHQRRIILKV